jgi:hypothetical protein
VEFPDAEGVGLKWRENCPIRFAAESSRKLCRGGFLGVLNSAPGGNPHSESFAAKERERAKFFEPCAVKSAAARTTIGFKRSTSLAKSALKKCVL